MTREQFNNLEVGDICVISRGHDQGRLCQVAYIEDESVVVRSVDGKRFNAMNCYNKLRLTSWRELKIMNINME